MRFSMMVRSRPTPTETATSKHARFVSAIADLPRPWGARDKWPNAKEPGTKPLEIVSLTRAMGGGMKGSINYCNRKYLPASAQFDDCISVEFDPNGIDYPHLIRSVFPRYVEGFNGYIGQIEDEEFVAADFDRWQKRKADDRDDVFRIFPVCFFDQTLCKSSFGLTPKQMARRLKGRVESASILGDGIMIVVSLAVMEFDEARKVDKKLRSFLRG